MGLTCGSLENISGGDEVKTLIPMQLKVFVEAELITSSFVDWLDVKVCVFVKNKRKKLVE